MNYYLVRGRDTKEAVYVYKTSGWLQGDNVEGISQAEFETYKEFGITTYVKQPLTGRDREVTVKSISPLVIEEN